MPLNHFKILVIVFVFGVANPAYAHDVNFWVEDASLDSFQTTDDNLIIQVSGKGLLRHQLCPQIECIKNENFSASRLVIHRNRTNRPVQNWDAHTKWAKESFGKQEKFVVSCLVDAENGVVRRNDRIEEVECLDMAITPIAIDGSGQKTAK